MDQELPPNKVCRKCGTENLATAARCLECNAPLQAGPAPREEILRIDGKSGLSLPPRGGFPWRGLFRVMSVPGCAVVAFWLSPSQEVQMLAVPATFLVALCLAIVAAVATDLTHRGRTTPHGGWAMVDGLLRGIGCLFTALAVPVVSVVAFFFALCYCSSNR